MAYIPLNKLPGVIADNRAELAGFEFKPEDIVRRNGDDYIEVNALSLFAEEGPESPLTTWLCDHWAEVEPLAADLPPDAATPPADAPTGRRRRATAPEAPAADPVESRIDAALAALPAQETAPPVTAPEVPPSGRRRGRATATPVSAAGGSGAPDPTADLPVGDPAVSAAVAAAAAGPGHAAALTYVTARIAALKAELAALEALV